MPSQVVTANETAQSIAAARENAVVQAKSMTIDNQRGNGDREITIEDVFTRSAYYGETSTAEVTEERFKVLAAQGDMITFGEADLKGVKCLGAMKVSSDVTDSDCDISVGYEHE